MPTSFCARLFVVSLALLSMSCATARPLDVRGEVETLRATERARLAALVAGDLATAAPFHADDFQLVNPFGAVFSKGEYLGALSSGQLDYLTWEPAEIAVRLEGHQAVIRYRSDIQVTFRGTTSVKTPHWHIDLYEKRGGKWQVVWSQATQVR